MNWIRQKKRLAIYLRDGLTCVYCGLSFDAGAQLTLDHVSNRGGNGADNLVTACFRCNCSKKDAPVDRFAAILAEDGNLAPDEDEPAMIAAILARVRRAVAAPLPVEAAQTLIEIRGSAARALKPTIRTGRILEQFRKEQSY